VCGSSSYCSSPGYVHIIAEGDSKVNTKVVKGKSRAFSGGLEEVLAVDDKLRLGWFGLFTAWYDSRPR